MLFRFKTMLPFVAAAPLLGAGPVSAQHLSLSIAPAYQETVPYAGPFAGLNLSGGFIEFLLTGRLSPAPLPMSFLAVQAAPEDPASPSGAIVPYSGPIPPGSVVLNATRNRVYRILPFGMMEAYPDHTDISAVLKSRLAIAD